MVSDDTGRKADKLSHQLNVALYHETDKLGAFGGSVWFQWYDDRRAEGGAKNGDLQEVDYTAWWSYPIKPIDTAVEFGWIAYTFPQESGDAEFTHEWYVSLSYNDRKLFGTEKPVLNPYATYYMDVDDNRGGWIEWGIFHRFALAEMGLADAPVWKDISITPSFMMAIDHGQLSTATRTALLRYGLHVGYDLGKALKLPEGAGALTLTGFVYFQDAIAEDHLKDRFYGGITLSYSR